MRNNSSDPIIRPTTYDKSLFDRKPKPHRVHNPHVHQVPVQREPDYGKILRRVIEHGNALKAG